MRTRPDLQFWGGTTIWVVPASAGATPRAVTEKSQDEVYDLKWINNGTVVFGRVADEVFYKQRFRRLNMGVGRTRSMGLQCLTIFSLSNPALEEYNMRSRLSRSLLLAVFLFPALCKGEAPNRVTILYDAFGKSATMTKAWGFSALVEFGGKRILFDTGGNAEILEHNVKALGVDLSKLDFVVISHRHGDHISGLNYLFHVNPTVKIYTPAEPWGPFGWAVPNSFYRKEESLAANMRYFDGNPPDMLSASTPWPQANFISVDATTEISPGIFLVPTISQVTGTIELREISIAIRGPQGLIIVDGCSHAGVEKILEAATKIDPHVRVLFGGLHLVGALDPDIQRISAALRDQWKLDYIAIGHCTGEPTFAALQKAFRDRYIYAGVGTVVNIP
jgi:7,8-dihydropterin-6-yl-methyl-4-(beta-D-ribofuranosyl)aminobenzene 5'-phosphate synthase